MIRRVTGTKRSSALFRFNGEVQGFAAQGVALHVSQSAPFIVDLLDRPSSTTLGLESGQSADGDELVVLLGVIRFESVGFE